MGSPVGYKSAGNAPSERQPEFAIPCVCDSMAEVLACASSYGVLHWK